MSVMDLDQLKPIILDQHWEHLLKCFSADESRLSSDDVIPLVETFLMSCQMTGFGQKSSQASFYRVDHESLGGISDHLALIVSALMACDPRLQVLKAVTLPWYLSVHVLQHVMKLTGLQLEANPFDRDRVLSAPLNYLKSPESLETLQHKILTQESAMTHRDAHLLLIAIMMAQKVSAGLDRLVVDLRYGEGTRISTRAEAAALGQVVVKTGLHFGIITIASLNALDEPLGRAFGASLEYQQCMDVMRGMGPPDLNEAVIDLASTISEATRGELENWLESGIPWEKWTEMIARQRGHFSDGENHQIGTEKMRCIELKSPNSGRIQRVQIIRLHQAFREMLSWSRNLELDASKVGFDHIMKTGRLIRSDGTLLRVHHHGHPAIGGVMEKLQDAFILE